MLRPIKIKYYVASMAARGFPADAVLEGTGLQAERLSDPAYLVDFQQCQQVISNMIQLTDDQGIGLEMGLHAEQFDFGIVIQAMLSSRTLRQAIGHWLQFRLLVGSLIHLRLLEDRKARTWSIVLTASEPLGFIYNFSVEEALVMGKRFGSAIAGADFQVQSVALSYPAPLHAPAYYQVFDCPIQFNAPQTVITIRSPWLDTPLAGSDDELNELYRRLRCTQIMRQIAGDNSLAPRLRAMFMAQPEAIPAIPLAAQSFGMSERTLRRRLQQEGASYQGLVNQVRFDMAATYLRTGALSQKEIGARLGFEDTNAFRRAFKAWAGKAPGRYTPNASTD